MPRLVPDPQYKNVVDQISHLNLWCDHINAPLADFLFASDKRIDFNEMTNLATGDAGQDLDGLLAKLHTIGHQSFIVDITTPDIQELGLVVMRAVIPGFHPMFLGHELRALGGSRLWEIPQKLGYRGVDRITGDNPIPHPFP
jgi:ribosomal protein S12 methylthiotransferase accessory factor